MKVNAQAVNFNADARLLDFVQSRLDKLELFYDRVVTSDVYLKVENTSVKENKIVEIKLYIPKDKFVVKKQCKTFEEAIDSACNSLERKLVKKKKKPRFQTSLKFL
ncbi:ribosome hibernation-promoting factor, HPF/YfiA family [Eudoraea adriatica]|jgi:putative sigma-54 modulation protein|uniref:ribosome hibernation-promoting factor, HPF/YfiA family n=1 Tax=Eudoraea adriatica TaxID=446681 RepID=UPI00036BBA7A|nr:ribosome-associated translation inhibitor RaiA [Eudoraea adriatica]